MRRLHSITAIAAGAAIFAAFPACLAAQRDAQELKRPRLESAADTNDWQAYYQYGMSQIRLKPKKAVGAFYWAGRLNPARAEPLYAQWVSTWMLKPAFLAEYVQGAEFIVNSAEARQIDTLALEAMIRNPLVHRGLRLLLFIAANDHTYGKGNWNWRSSPETQAWLDYSEGRFADAAREWGELVAKSPRKVQYHEDRAYAFAAMGQLDSAVAAMGVLLQELEKQDRKKLIAIYESKAVYLYALGIMNAQARKYDAAREAFGRALTEDLSMYMAHGALGTMALAQGDSATALAEYDLAVQIQGGDPVLLNDYGLLLLKARRTEEAKAVLRKAVEANPWFASPRYLLGLALDRLGEKDAAVVTYREFIARAPRNADSQISLARQRIADMGGEAASR